MPKIIINEIDDTVAPVDYENFTVVIPVNLSTITQNEQEDSVIDSSTIEFPSFCREGAHDYIDSVVAKVTENSNAKAIYKTACTFMFERTVKKLAEQGLKYSTEEEILADIEDIEITSSNIEAQLKVFVSSLKTATIIRIPVITIDESGITEYRLVEAFDKVFKPTENTLGLGLTIARKLLSLGYTALLVNADADTLDLLKDKTNYDFRYIVEGDCAANIALIKKLAEIASKRGDCTVLLGINDKKGIPAIEAFVDSITLSKEESKYCAFFAPNIKYRGMETLLPAYVHYLNCAAYSKNYGFAEWYAVAGYNRGKCDDTIEFADQTFGEVAVDHFNKRSQNDLTEGGSSVPVNLVVKVKNSYYLWGNRTAAVLEEELKATNFLNIRQLCTTLKKELYVACRQFTFDPNSDTLWINFTNKLRPLLERMKADNGIKDFKIIKENTNKKAELKALIRIVPIEAVEDFELTVTLEDSLGGTVSGDFSEE